MDGGRRQDSQDASLGFVEVAHHAFGGMNDLFDQAFVIGDGENRAPEAFGRRVKILQRGHDGQVFTQCLAFAYTSYACAE